MRWPNDKGGSELSEAGKLAHELGISIDRVRRLGGAEKLRSLSPDALAVLIGNSRFRQPRKARLGGLKTRGFAHGRSDFLITPHVRMLAGFDEMISEEELAATSVEGAE